MIELFILLPNIIFPFLNLNKMLNHGVDNTIDIVGKLAREDSDLPKESSRIVQS